MDSTDKCDKPISQYKNNGVSPRKKDFDAVLEINIEPLTLAPIARITLAAATGELDALCLLYGRVTIP